LEDHGSRPIWAKSKIPSQLTAGHGVVFQSSQATWETEIRRIVVQASLDKKWDPISKITRAKRAG
jgi:hypothetical protein